MCTIEHAVSDSHTLSFPNPQPHDVYAKLQAYERLCQSVLPWRKNRLGKTAVPTLYPCRKKHLRNNRRDHVRRDCIPAAFIALAVADAARVSVRESLEALAFERCELADAAVLAVAFRTRVADKLIILAVAGTERGTVCAHPFKFAGR